MTPNSKSTDANGSGTPRKAREECFVIMPLSDPDGYDPGHFKQVYEDLFVPACQQAGYKAVRADEVRQTNLIHLDVLQRIIDSPMALCDLSSRNPNVLFELGLRQAFDKPVVLVQEFGTPSIFDIHPMRYTNYHKDMLYRDVVSDQVEITTAIKATAADIGNEKSVNSIVKLLSLTQPASLSKISESDKDSAVLQVLMAEIGNLRSEFHSLMRDGDAAKKRSSFDIGDESPIRYIDQYGLEKYLVDRTKITGKLARKLVKESSNAMALYNRLLTIRGSDGTNAARGIGNIQLPILEKALSDAKERYQLTITQNNDES